MALKRAVMRFEASLNAQKALEDKRYAETVANIAAAKKEAEEKTKAASSEFKVQLLALSSTVKELIAKDKEDTDEKLNKMALEFNQALAAVRGELAKDRKHAEDKLEAGTSAVWAKMKANQEMQAKKNAEMAAAA